MSRPRAQDPIERFRLDNGLRVVLQRDAFLPLVAINLWYEVGSRDERPGRTGLAHLFEHMLFQGSEHVGTHDHFRYVQQVGGVANGSTWFDRTNYYETLPSHYLELGLWLESDRLGFLLAGLDAEKLETQREVVLNERLQRVDNQPYGRAFERLHELLYPPDHPYHWPVIGYAEDIRAASLDDVTEFFRRFYVPGNAVLSLAGDFEPKRARERVERYFGDIPAGEPLPRSHRSPPPLAAEIRETLADRVELPRVYVGFRCPGFGDDGWYAGDLLSLVLAGGKSSPLYRELVYERQLAKSVSAQILPCRLDATFLVVATAGQGVDVERLESALHAVLAEVGRRIDPEDRRRSVNRVQTAWFDELQSLDRRADLLSEFTTFFDEPQRIESEPERYAAIGDDELREFAATYLDPGRRVVLTVVPES